MVSAPPPFLPRDPFVSDGVRARFFAVVLMDHEAARSADRHRVG